MEEILPVISFIIRYYNARFSWVYGINYYGAYTHRFGAKTFYNAGVIMVSHNSQKNSNNEYFLIILLSFCLCWCPPGSNTVTVLEIALGH